MRVFGLLSQTYNANILHSYQRERVRELMAHARTHVPFYADMLGDAVTLDQAPILDRTHLFDYASQFVSAVLPRGQAARGLRYTAGTTGQPVRVVETNLTHDWQLALQLRDLEWSGLDPTRHLAEIVWCEGQGHSSNRWDPDLDELCATGPSSLLPITLDPLEQLEWLQRIQPNYLRTYPTNLELLVEVMGEAPPLSLTHLKSTVEPLSAQLRARAARHFHVFDTYASAELGLIASDCHLGRLHVHSESVVVEILNNRGLPCPVGEVGRVVITALHNYATPLIRYALGDRAAWGSPCRCGLPHPVIDRVAGRDLPFFTHPDGSRWSPASLVSAVHQIGSALQWQLQENSPGWVTLRVVSGEWTSQHTRRFEEAVARFYNVAAPRVELEVVRRLPLHAGRLRQVIACR